MQISDVSSKVRTGKALIREFIARHKPDYVSVRTLQGDLSKLPDFPSSAGSPMQMLDLTLLGARTTYDSLLELARRGRGSLVSNYETIDALLTDEHLDLAARMKAAFDRHGSDKSNVHDYHKLYSWIFRELRGDIKAIAEIGLGTNNVDVPSNMGAAGKPGASLRAWREITHGTARIVGMDIDKRVLFQDSPIETHFIDQLKPSSIVDLGTFLGEKSLDVLIDDGLHAPLANINVLNNASKYVRAGGFIIIEDIAERSLPIWELAMLLAPRDWKMRILKTRCEYVFVVQV